MTAGAFRLDEAAASLTGIASPTALGRSAQLAVRALRAGRLEIARSRVLDSGKAVAAGCQGRDIDPLEVRRRALKFCFDFNDVMVLRDLFENSAEPALSAVRAPLDVAVHAACERAQQVLEHLAAMTPDAPALRLDPQLAWLQRSVARLGMDRTRTATLNMTA